MTLESFVVGELFTFLLIFIRISAGIMVMPGVGERYVPMQVRLAFAIMVSLVMTPTLQHTMPPIPTSPLALMILMAGELVIGLFFGQLARTLVSVMHTVGMVISYQSSLAAATMFDISQAGQGSAIGNFLSVTAIVLLFATNLHHLMLQALFDSYTLFIPGQALFIEDMSYNLTRLVADVFNIAIQLSAPVVAVALLVNLGAGVLSRLMPNMQVFFVLIPVQIQVAMLVMMITLSGVMLWYLDFAESRLNAFLGLE